MLAVFMELSLILMGFFDLLVCIMLVVKIPQSDLAEQQCCRQEK